MNLIQLFISVFLISFLNPPLAKSAKYEKLQFYHTKAGRWQYSVVSVFPPNFFKIWVWEFVAYSLSGCTPSNPGENIQKLLLYKHKCINDTHMFTYTLYHNCPLAVLSLCEHKGTWWVENFIIYFLCFTWETVQKCPVWCSHTSCLSTSQQKHKTFQNGIKSLSIYKNRPDQTRKKVDGHFSTCMVIW